MYDHNLCWGLCATFSAYVRAVRCSAWTAQTVYLVRACVYVRWSACAARALYYSSGIRVCVRFTVHGMDSLGSIRSNFA